MDDKQDIIMNEEDNNELIDLDKKKPEQKKKNFVVDWIMPIALAFVLALLINKFLLYKVYIPSGSMIPTLNEGDHLYVTRLYNLEKIERGDVLVFYSEELSDTLIKRVIGLPGDQVDINNGVVSINGEVIEEDYVKNDEYYTRSFSVPEGKYLFLGDNRALSYDSRKWINPYIDGKDIQGKAQIKVFPFSDFGTIE